MKVMCPKCGRWEIAINGLCKVCFFQGKLKQEEFPEVMTCNVCPSCGVASYKGWEDMDLEELVIKALNANLTDYEHFSIEDLELQSHGHHLEYRFLLAMIGASDREGLCKEFTGRVNLPKLQCVPCSKQAGGYYESIIQVRGTGKSLDSREKSEISDIVNETLEAQDNKMSYVAKFKEKDGGFDYYISTQRAAKQVLAALGMRFGVSHSSSATLVGEKSGKRIYRVTFLLRIPRLRKGDLVSDGDSVYLINISGTFVRGKDIESGTTMTWQNEDKLSVLGSIFDKQKTVCVSSYGEVLEVLDPVTFNLVQVSKPPGIEVASGEEVNVVKTEKGIFVVEGL